MAGNGAIDPLKLSAKLSKIAEQEDAGNSRSTEDSGLPSEDPVTHTPTKKRVGFSTGSFSPESILESPFDTPKIEVTDTDSYFPRVDGIDSPAGPADAARTPPSKKSALRPSATPTTQIPIDDEEEIGDVQKRQSILVAQAKALKVAQSVGTYSASAPGSRRNSVSGGLGRKTRFQGDAMQLQDMSTSIRDLAMQSRSEDDSEEDDEVARQSKRPRKARARRRRHRYDSRSKEPHDLTYTPEQLDSGQATPAGGSGDEAPRPQRFGYSKLGLLLRALERERGPHRDFMDMSATNSAQSSRGPSPERSADSSPLGTHHHRSTANSSRSWLRPFGHSRGNSATSISTLIQQSGELAGPGGNPFSEDDARNAERRRERKARAQKRSVSGSIYHSVRRQWTPLKEEELRIKNHIEEVKVRQQYIIKLCRALMAYGAPTHRLETYMQHSANVLAVEGSFLYLPGCMIISFGDSSIGMTEVKLIRMPQAVDLGKLADAHEIYKDVVHDKIGAFAGKARLNELLRSKQKFKWHWLILMYGIAAITVGPFAFEARPIDFPILFLLGCIVGFLQHWVSPRSDMFANVFEVIATILTSFLARAFGSIRGGDVFCFSTLSQSSIALILPGWIVLCASMELQSRNIIAGSIRMVYAIIYSLFIGYGITIGSALYGAMDSNASSEVHCRAPLKGDLETWWKFFPFAILFALMLALINQAKWRQIPWMVIVAFAGYVVNYFADRLIPKTPQISNAFGAFAVGLLANLHARLGNRTLNAGWNLWENHKYSPRGILHNVFRRLSRAKRSNDVEAEAPSRCSIASSASTTTPFTDPDGTYVDKSIPSPNADTTYKDKPVPDVPKPKHKRRLGYSLAAASMLPAIMVQVPSGIAVNGSLVQGIDLANNVTSSSNSSRSTVTNGGLNGSSFNVAVNVVEVAIGITVGLFMSSLVVYIFGRRKRGLFSL